MYTGSGINHSMDEELAGIYNLEIKQSIKRIMDEPSHKGNTLDMSPAGCQRQLEIDMKNDKAIQKKIKNQR